MKATLSSGAAVQAAQARAAVAARRSAATQHAQGETLDRLTSGGLPGDVLESVQSFVQSAPTDEVRALRLRGLERVLAITPCPTGGQVAALQEAFHDVEAGGDDVAARLEARVPELQARALLATQRAASGAAGPPASASINMAVLQRIAADPLMRFAETARDVADDRRRHLSHALSSQENLHSAEPSLCARTGSLLEANRAPWVIMTGGLTIVSTAALALIAPLPPPLRVGLMLAGVASGLAVGWATHKRLNRHLRTEVETQVRARLEPQRTFWETRATELTALRNEVRDQVVARHASQDTGPAPPTPTVKLDEEAVVIGGIRIGRRG